MSTSPIIRYPLDPTGTNPDNLVQGELHSPVRRGIRAIATTYGAFYSGSLVVRDAGTNQVLTKGVQYYAAELYEMPTAKYGKEVCAIVMIIDASVGDQISLDYQAVGGEFSTAADAVVAQIGALNLDDRPVTWGSIIAKPSEYPPSMHLHDIGDVYGFEYIVHSLERVRAAILMGDDVSHDAIYQYIDNMRAGFQSSISANSASIQAHIADHNNPHAVTAAQVGAYTKAAIDALLATLQSNIDAHASRTDNPHNATAAQVGAYTKNQVDALITTLQQSLNSHINAANPHPQYVRNDAAQGLDGAHQAQARNNINAESAGTAAATMSAHTSNGNPHPQYLTGMGTIGTRYVDTPDASHASGVAFVYDVGVEMVSGNQFRIVAYRRVGTAVPAAGGCGTIGSSV